MKTRIEVLPLIHLFFVFNLHLIRCSGLQLSLRVDSNPSWTPFFFSISEGPLGPPRRAHHQQLPAAVVHPEPGDRPAGVRPCRAGRRTRLKGECGRNVRPQSSKVLTVRTLPPPPGSVFGGITTFFSLCCCPALPSSAHPHLFQRWRGGDPASESAHAVRAPRLGSSLETGKDPSNGSFPPRR